MEDRHFTEPTDQIEGTVASASPSGITLKEYPGRIFQFSSVGMSAADMSARVLGEHNNMLRSEVAREVETRRQTLRGRPGLSVLPQPKNLARGRVKKAASGSPRQAPGAGQRGSLHALKALAPGTPKLCCFAPRVSLRLSTQDTPGNAVFPSSLATYRAKPAEYRYRKPLGIHPSTRWFT